MPMKMKHVKNYPYLNLPVIGAIFLFLASMFMIFKGWYSVTNSAVNTKYRVTRRWSDGTTTVSNENGGSPMLIIFLLAIILWGVALGEVLILTFAVFFNTYAIFLFIFCFSGFLSALDTEDIDAYLSVNKENGSVTFHFILGLILSFSCAYLLSNAGLFKIKGYSFFIYYIPISILIFVGIFAPISISITSTINFYKRKRDLKFHKNPLNFIILISILIFSGHLKSQNISGMKFESFLWFDYWAEITFDRVEKQYEQLTELIGIGKDRTESDRKLDAFAKKEGVVYFNIKTKPEYAEIQIFEPNVEYKSSWAARVPYQAGEYDIRVSKEGYHSVRAKYSIKNGLFDKEIILKKMTPEDYKHFKSRKKGNAYLRVRTEPKDAKVQIMNIKRFYKPGMILDLGQYDIRVSRKGYNTHREVVTLGPNGIDDYIKLKANK